MTANRKADELVDCVADEQLLSEYPSNLPAAIGRPPAVAPSGTRGRIVALGATLTGLTLIAGVALVVLGVVDALSGGIDLLAIAALALGVALAGTHWGWVHVAEATADAIEHRRDSEIAGARRQWLLTIEPYVRYEVTTSVAEDGSITINRVRHRPVPSGARRFTFARETERVEVHSGDEAAAAVAERAELLRRDAAADTERERERFAIVADAHQRAVLGQLDEQQELAVRRAGSQALSEQINSNLRDPPLSE
jgi:hypothetical protein